MDQAQEDRRAGGEAAPGEGPNAYQVTLAGLIFPVAGHYAFNALAAGALWLLGHPVIAAVAMAVTCGVDTAQQLVLRRWMRNSAGVDPDQGLRQLAALCATRVSIYVTPTLGMALIGDRAELVYFAVQMAALLALALSAGSFSRIIFWALATPLLVAMSILGVTQFPLAQGAAVMSGLVTLLALLALISENTRKAITSWRTAFDANVAMMKALEAARDQAVAERAAADEAREAARSAHRAKSAFLATMSHEIRTPMNGVLGMAQLLQRDETDPAQRERLEVLIDSGEYLLSILNDILDVSKIDAGRLDIVTAPEDVRRFLDRLVGFWGPRADERGLALSLQVDSSVPDVLAMDALRLRQVMFNLVGNALKFTDEGSVEISAEARPEGDDAVRLHLTVSDTGPGVAAHHLPQLFDRFSQADDSEMRRFGGTGLGLAIVKQLVELMGGRVWAESEPGKGSAFHIDVPLKLADARPAEQPVAARPEATDAPEGLTVLAVDDNAVNLLVLEQLLGSFGYKVARASSGAEALEVLGTQPFDLVLMDIQMPEMTGTEALQRLRACAGPNEGAPVVALTADVTSGGRQRYLELGFTEHCSKPIQLAELMEAIARAVSSEAAAVQAA